MRILCLYILAGLLLGVPVLLPAQEVLITDFHEATFSGGEKVNRSRTLPAASTTPANLRATATAPFPFFEDFSASLQELDTLKWLAFPIDDYTPTISNLRARQCPSKGALSFDGATYDKKKHSPFLEVTYADFIETQPFDLSTFTISDSLILSFFYQGGGWSDAPEDGDSLILAFDTTGNGDYVTVWAATGTGIAQDSFFLAQVVLDDSAYFHSEFRFRFENYGSINGEVDVWHIDYITFDANRSLSQTDFLDVSPTAFTGSLLGEYTHLPYQFYDGGAVSNPIGVELSNVSGPLNSVEIGVALSEPVSGSTLMGTTSLAPPSVGIQPYANSIVSAGTFDIQIGNLDSVATLRVTAQATATQDTRPENDILVTDFRVDSLLGYDDGQPDAGYGLTYARSFCQEFRIPEPDTISAVWIAFAPTLNYNSVISQSTCMDGETFKLTLWDTLAPDSFTTQQGTGMVVNYDTAVNYFQRFTFINPQVVDTIFWLGIRQSTNKPLGVGFDKNGPLGKIYYEGQNAQFISSTQQGVLMIRPEFASIKEELASRPSEQTPDLVQGLFYPNPLHEGQLNFRLEGTMVKDGEINLWDMQGRKVFSYTLKGSGQEFQMSLPGGLRSGIYLAEFQGRSIQGKQIGLRKRLVIQNQ